MAEDFFVRFGSNASAFGGQLDKDLAGARRAIGTFTKQLADMESVAANRRAATMKHLAAMSAEADRVQKRIDAIGANGAAAGVNSEAADLQQMARTVYQDIASIGTALDGVLIRLKGAADQIDRHDTNLAEERKRQNYSAGAASRADGGGVRDPRTGLIAKAGTEGAVPFRQQDIARIIEQAAARTPVQIDKIPQATIDEAAFQRVVTAVERNVTATERVEAAIDRLGGRLGGAGAAEGAAPAAEAAVAPAVQAAVETAKQAVEREQGPSKRALQLDKTIDELTGRERQLRLEIEQLARAEGEAGTNSAELTRRLNEVAQVEEKLTSARQARASEETRAEQQERQRRAAQRAAAAQAGITVTPEERRRRQDERARLELAANPERLAEMVGTKKDQLGKADLVRIAETLTRQGYTADLGSVRGDTGLPRMSNDAIREVIAAAGREYVATGRATAEDLSARRVERAPGVIPTDVQNLLTGELPRAAQRFTQELGRLGISVEQAYQLIGQSMRTGGEDPRREKIKGRLEVGAAIGDELREAVSVSPGIIEDYNRQRREAARRDVVSAMRADQGFNPYEMDLKTTGRDTAAQQARRDVAALLHATQEIDQFATDLGEMDRALNGAQRKQEALLRRLQAFDNIRNPTSEQTSDYLKNLDEHQRQRDIVEQRRADLDAKLAEARTAGLGDANFMRDPSFQAGVAQRAQSRMYFDAHAENDRFEAQQAATARQALRDATLEYLGGARTFATSQGNTRDYFTRTLPGVRRDGRGLAFADPEMLQVRSRPTDAAFGPLTQEQAQAQKQANAQATVNQRAMRQMNAGVSGYTRNLLNLIDEIAEGDRTEAQLNETRKKVEVALNRLLSGYQRAFPNQQMPEMAGFLPAHLDRMRVEGEQRTNLKSVETGFDTDWLERAWRSRNAEGRVTDDLAMGVIRRENQSGAGRDAIAQLDANAAAALKDPKRAEQARAQLLTAIRGNIRAINTEIKGLGAEDVERRQLLEAQREELRAARKRVSGRVDPQDLEAQYAAIQKRQKSVEAAEVRLARVTETLAAKRAELADREQFVRGGLTGDSQQAYDVALAKRTDLEERINRIQTSPEIRADREEGALDPKSVAAAEAARAELGKLKTELGGVNATLAQYERLVHELMGFGRQSGEYANLHTEGLQRGLGGAQEDVLRTANRLQELRSGLQQMEALFEASKPAFQEQNARRGDKAMREPNIPGFGGNGNGTVPPGTTGTGGPGEPGGPGRQGILAEILAALNRIDGRLKGTLKVTGNVTTKEGAGADSAGAKSTRLPRSTPQGRADFESSIGATIPAVGQLLQSGSNVEAAAELISRGVMSETRVLDLFRDKLQQTAAEAKQFQTAVRGVVGDQRYADAAAAAAEQRAKREAEGRFPQRGGGSVTIDEARSAMNTDLEARAKAAAAEAEKEAKGHRDAATAAIVHRQALSRLSAQTRVEVAELERMAKAGDQDAAAQERLAAQMAKVYGLAARDMRRGGASATEVNQAVGGLYRGAGIQTSGEEVTQMRSAARALGYQFDREYAAGLVQGGSQMEQVASHLFGAHGFWNRVIGSTGTFLVRNFSAGLVFGLTNELQQAVDDAIKTQQTFVRLSSTLESTGKETGNLRVELQSLSSGYGVALNDLYNTAAKLAGVFETPDDLEGGTRVVAQLQMISENALSADESVGVLTSVWAAFQDELSREGGVEHVSDVATALQNLTGVNIEDTLEGVARLAGLAKQMGISFDETATFVAQISRETNTSGATAGEQLSRILEQMQGAGGQLALKQTLGADVFDRNTKDGAINYGNVLKELIANWDNLSKSQQAALVHNLAGSRQAATFNALMDNGAHTLENLTKAQNSQGAAAERMAKLMKTLSGETARFRSNFQNLVNELVQTGFLDSLGAGLHVINILLSNLNHLLALMNELGDSNPAIGGILHMTAALAGAAVAAKLLAGTIAGLKSVGFVEAALGGAAGFPTVSRFTGGAAAAGSGAAAAAEAELAATEIAVTKGEQKRLTSALALSGTMDALIATELELEAAQTARVRAEVQRMALIQAGTASEAELTAANEAVVAADARLAAALTARTAAEGEAAAAAGLSGKRGFGATALSLGTKAIPYALAAAVVLGGEKGQRDRVNAASDISGADLPQGATAVELKAVADTYAKAATEVKDSVSKGFFGLGVGPSLTKALDRTIRGSEPYDAARQNEDNQRVIGDSLKQAAAALEHIETQSRERTSGEVALPTITSFDTDYLNQRLQELTDRGQSAGQQLRELNDALFNTGDAAEKVKGSFTVNGRATNDLGDWASLVQPGVQKLLADAGLSAVGVDLQTALGARNRVTSLASDGSATMSYVDVPRNQQRVKGTGQAIRETMANVLSDAADQLGIGFDVEVPSERDLASLTGRGFGDAVEKYKEFRKNLNKFFAKDRHSYKTLMGEAELSHKDATTLIGYIDQLTESALGNLPETDLAGRSALNRRRVAQIRAAIGKNKGGRPTSEQVIRLQAAENALVESRIAELDRTRQAAQSADHSKAGLYRAAQAETRQAVRLAIRHGSADALASVIANAGRAGQILAQQMIKQLQQELNAYKAAQAALAAVAGSANAAIAEAIGQGYGAPEKPPIDQKTLDQLKQAASIPTGPTSKSPWFTGSDVPGLEDANAMKNDANQLRQDRAALAQARLGVAEAYANARGDAVRAAQIEVKIAAASLAAARADLAAAKTTDERLQAQTAIAQAQAQMIAAHAAVAQAQADLVQSQYDVSIALAEAAGHTVRAAMLRAEQAQAALRSALKQSHGKNTAAVNQARAGAIAAQAAARDAKLQDQLDTIDFNLQMNKMTQASAIAALRNILRTQDLTKEQRRQLLLQIKGMQDSLKDTQWNFGDIKMPTPYQMRRYIEGNRRGMRDAINHIQDAFSAGQPSSGGGGGAGGGTIVHDNHSVTITINAGTDIRKVEEVVKKAVGKGHHVRTAQPRRR